MNIKAVKKHICEQLQHNVPIQRILSPEAPLVDGPEGKIPDPDFVKPEMPDWSLVCQWSEEDEVFRRAMEDARRQGAAYRADEMMLLKERCVADPRNAPAYKAAMDMIKTSAMWGDSKFSERTIQERKDTTPTDPATVIAMIKQLKAELSPYFGGQTIDMDVLKLPGKKPLSEKQRANLERMRTTRSKNAAARRAKKDES